MKTNLITAIYGAHDDLKPLPLGHGFDEAICYTDNPKLRSDTWQIVLQPFPDMSPRLASKMPKFTPWKFSTADLWVWLDGSFTITNTGFKDFCLSSLGEHELVVWDHPDRHMRPDVYAEANFSRHMEKYQNQNLDQQVAHYASRGLPAGSGLYACGTIVWRDTEACRVFGEAWMSENLRWTIQDQLSFPYLAWKLQPNFTTFPAHEYENPYLQWNHHRSER